MAQQSYMLQPLITHVQHPTEHQFSEKESTNVRMLLNLGSCSPEK